MSSASELTVIEVYGWAAEIGKDLEKLIDAVGSDLVVELMPKVVRVLEQLELCVKQRENGINELQQLQEELQSARHAGSRATDENLRLISDVKLLEDHRQKEIRDWMAMAKELEEETNRLKAQLSEKEGIVDQEKAHEQQALQVLYQLKETVDKQRDQLRAKDDEMATRALEVEALQQHVDRLAKVTADLRRKNELLSTMAKNFIHEKSELQSELRAMGKETALPEHHGLAGRDVVDGERQQKSSDENGDSEAEKENAPMTDMVTIDMTGKAIIDLSDPNRPRFTLRELQTVLQERDELKLDVMELEDELQQYRPKEEGSQNETEADQKKPRSNSNAGKSKGEPLGIKRLFSFLFRGKNNAKSSSAPEDETTWEFLEKPVQPVPDVPTLAVPTADQRGGSLCAASEPVPPKHENSLVPEEKPGEDAQRRKSYSGPIIQVSTKEPFKQRERMSCVRTESKQLIEVGHDIASLCGPDLNSAPTVAATAATGRPISRNNSNNSNSSIAVEEITMVDRKAAGVEAIGQGSSTDVPKVLINNNDSEEIEVEM
ncbi:RILP-like protein 1 [Patiria miniata]|uniref:RILP-like protein 1 n=1 Tax=Patiria miniata TaxID=46514 RepID=A0A913ZY07_PATMI|nr:RILP-like protein 1 [Patiria miniata]